MDFCSHVLERNETLSPLSRLDGIWECLARTGDREAAMGVGDEVTSAGSTSSEEKTLKRGMSRSLVGVICQVCAIDECPPLSCGLQPGLIPCSDLKRSSASPRSGLRAWSIVVRPRCC
jgi:hypothetical protein